MKFNHKILSIPPYISTSWKNIASLHMESHPSTLVLVVTLHSGARIEVPHLDRPVIEAIFSAHTHYMEQEEKLASSKTIFPHFPIAEAQEQIFSLGLPLMKNGIAGLENFGSVLQHNPEQASAPDLPSDILEKISQLSKTLGIEDLTAVPKPEPHCNCMHCQIARALQNGLNDDSKEGENPNEEIVSDEDLKFRTWDVLQTDEKLYTVTNPLDSQELYHVYLGNPIGCTCGNPHCEHIHAVLNT